MNQKNKKYCIIGAGSSGLTAGKNLKQLGVPFEIIERADDLGGLWNYNNPESSVYRSTHLISSKPLTEFTDFPLPETYPDYPGHRQVYEYFQAYASKFGLREKIKFNTSVEKVQRENGEWAVTFAGGDKQNYRGLIIANGHLRDPRFPDYPGAFAGEVLHSKQYKTPDILRDKRVLVVGAGNSGCDIAVEAAQNAARTFHSVRRGYHYIPKFMFAKPSDQIGEALLKLRIPLFMRRAINTTVLRLIYGQPHHFGLQKPDHKLFESHPIINSQIYYYLGHGDIEPKPDIAALQGKSIAFKDGSEEEIDLIIYATGYNISFPFIDTKHLNWNENHPKLFMNVFHPEYDNLFVAGMIQPDSGQWGLVDYQAQLIARFIDAQHNNQPIARRFTKLKSNTTTRKGTGIRYLKSYRHAIEVEHFSYRRDLKKLIKTF